MSVAECRSERGVALAVVSFVLVIVGGLVSAAFFVGLQERRIGQNTLGQQEAFTAAEAAAEGAVVAWNPRLYNAMAVGTSVATSGSASLGRGWYRRTVRRLSRVFFLIQAEGFSADSTARQAVGLLLRLSPLRLPARAALQTAESVELAGNARVSGVDRSPAMWTGCPVPSDTVPNIGVLDASELPLGSLKAGATTVLPGGTYWVGPRIWGGRLRHPDRHELG